jgi:hypothetical protein
MMLVNAKYGAAATATWHPHRLRARTLFLAAAVAAGAAQPAAAEVRVSGHAGSIQLLAQDATVEEVLAALNESFGLQYRARGSLDRLVSGTYSGSLRRVVWRVLDGYDFMVQSSNAHLGVVVVGASSAVSQFATAPRSPDVGRRARRDE